VTETLNDSGDNFSSITVDWEEHNESADARAHVLCRLAKAAVDEAVA
jgi:hypothetical protein